MTEQNAGQKGVLTVKYFIFLNVFFCGGAGEAGAVLLYSQGGGSSTPSSVKGTSARGTDQGIYIYI